MFFKCRDLRHENVVRYYGSANRKTSGGLKWIMVMELCQTTLKGYYCDGTLTV